MNRERCYEAIAHLTGSCHSLESVTTEAEREDKEFLETIDENIFCCDCCGWWCEIEERGEEGDVCTDCEEEGHRA